MKIRNIKILFVGFIASSLTLPYLWFILPLYINASYYVIIGEILVSLFESLVYNQLLNLKIYKAILISLIANAASYFIGFLILPLF